MTLRGSRLGNSSTTYSPALDLTRSVAPLVIQGILGWFGVVAVARIAGVAFVIVSIAQSGNSTFCSQQHVATSATSQIDK